MKLANFRLLRIPAQRDSPFCYEVFVARRQQGDPSTTTTTTTTLPPSATTTSSTYGRSSRSSSSNNNNTVIDISPPTNALSSCSFSSSCSSCSSSSLSSPTTRTKPTCAGDETLFMTHVPLVLSLERMQRYLEELTGGCAVTHAHEKAVWRILPEPPRRFSSQTLTSTDSSPTQSCSTRDRGAAIGGGSLIRLLFFSFDSAAAVDAVLAAARPLAADSMGHSTSATTSTTTTTTARAAAAGAGAAAAAAVRSTDIGMSFPQRMISPPCMPLRLTRLQQWISEAAALFRTPTALQQEVDSFMEEYDLKKHLEQQQQKQRQQTDEEGFTLVTSDGATAADGTTFRSVRRREMGPALRAAAFSLRNPAGAETGELVKNLFFQQVATAGRYVAGTGFLGGATSSQRKKKRKGGVEEDFYRFQRREKKRREFAGRLQSMAEEERFVAAMGKVGVPL